MRFPLKSFSQYPILTTQSLIQKQSVGQIQQGNEGQSLKSNTITRKKQRSGPKQRQELEYWEVRLNKRLESQDRDGQSGRG